MQCAFSSPVSVASIHHVTLSMAFNRHAFALTACEKSLVSSSLHPHLPFAVSPAGWKQSIVDHTQANSYFVFWIYDKS